MLLHRSDERLITKHYETEHIETTSFDVANNTGITFVAMVLTAILGIISKTLLARTLGPAGVGQYTLIVLVPSLAVVIGSLGINVANINFVANRRFEIRQIVSNALIWSIGSGFFIMSLCLILIPVFYNRFFSDVPLSWLQFIVLAIPVLLLLNNLLAIIQGKNQIGRYNLVGFVSTFSSLLALGFLLLILRLGLSGAILAWFSGVVTSLFLAVYYVSLLTPIRWRFNLHVFRESVRFGAQAYLANIMGILVRRVDVLVVAAIAGNQELGYYSLAFAMGELLWYAASSASVALAPAVGSLNKIDASLLTCRVIRIMLVFLFISVASLIWVSPYLITMVFGKDFLPASAALRWLLPGIVTASIEKILAADLIGRGHPRITMVSAFVALVITVIADFALIPQMGGSGAALASSIAYSVAAVITMVLFLRLTGRGLKEIMLITHSDLQFCYNHVFRIQHKLKSG